jgi:hypothetical protein
MPAETEHLKLSATLLNTLAAAVITLGIFAPLAPYVQDGTVFTKDFDNALPAWSICLWLALSLHILGQAFLLGLDDIDEA